LKVQIGELWWGRKNLNDKSLRKSRDSSLRQPKIEGLGGGRFESERKILLGTHKQQFGMKEGAMSDRDDSRGQRKDHLSQNIIPDMGARLDRGNPVGHERGATPVHRGETSVDVSRGADMGPNSEANELNGSSPELAGNLIRNGTGASKAAADLARIPEGVRATVASKAGEYDARRLRSQREIIRDVMLSAAGCETWLTLGELRALTRYGEASISAQLRHLRKTENGGYDVIKRHREGVSPVRPGTDGRGECVWEYRMKRGLCGDRAGSEPRLETVGA
jgi:hypothetical protein